MPWEDDMTIQDFGAIGEFVSSVVVVITLVYLTVQVRQGNALARAQTRQSMMEQVRADLHKLVDEPSIQHCFTKEELLTPDEKVKFTAWLAAAMRQREYEWAQYRNGVIDRSTWETYRRLIPLHLGTPRALKWWQASTQLFEPDFVGSIDELLASPLPTGFFEEIQALDL
jgi:hypothetical protein